MEMYGKSDSDKMADDILVCRKIVSEIVHFEVTQRQIWYIIYLLGLNLEDVEAMRAVTGFVKECMGDELFLSSAVEGGSSGKTD
jgi:hypothetical protein